MSASSRRNKLHLTEDESQTLRGQAALGAGRSREARRAQIILLTAEGCSAMEIASRLGCSHQTVRVWRTRYQMGGLREMRRAH